MASLKLINSSMNNLIKSLLSTRHYLPPSFIHTRSRTMSIKVGDTIPKGTFGTIPYTPALDDAVGFQVILMSCAKELIDFCRKPAVSVCKSSEAYVNRN